MGVKSAQFKSAYEAATHILKTTAYVYLKSRERWILARDNWFKSLAEPEQEKGEGGEAPASP